MRIEYIYLLDGGCMFGERRPGESEITLLAKGEQWIDRAIAAIQSEKGVEGVNAYELLFVAVSDDLATLCADPDIGMDDAEILTYALGLSSMYGDGLPSGIHSGELDLMLVEGGFLRRHADLFEAYAGKVYELFNDLSSRGDVIHPNVGVFILQSLYYLGERLESADGA